MLVFSRNDYSILNIVSASGINLCQISMSTISLCGEAYFDPLADGQTRNVMACLSLLYVEGLQVAPAE